MQPSWRAVTILLTISAAACGGAVTDPLDAFLVSPEPVLGRWITVTTSGDTLEADIESGAGFLFGSFQFERTGIGFQLQFNDASWDGQAIRFNSEDLFGTGAERIDWTALHVPASESQTGRAILRLFPRVGGGVPFSVEYGRPD